MQAAGVRCSQRLGDLAALLPAATEAELVALLASIHRLSRPVPSGRES